MGLPELAQADQHRSRQRHVTVLAALGFADVNTAFGSVVTPLAAKAYWQLSPPNRAANLVEFSAA